ncbi:origin recognition complex subunit 5 C-terminus-domain-containing protein [Dunaliella salina]|uniref:Origin recognition complex subunit 5 C-terminus-domain-containing protein n=1 Tax=Dunaliella salina TaxID=3046 RepID=A0ABQ7GHQ9_DUNSA|nr:origin recognition complex subunit 5 C-terminus-domain-containing protein [Dunaliella salina]|eukprot:KAF5834146.1 origin recognition complex subunit 5 C-terminus-domain-containing protein [Dunaliella salina]
MPHVRAQSADELLRSSQQGAAALAEGVGGSCAWGSLPRSARLILVAAYLASHNKPSSDRAVFDATSGSKRGGRKRGGAGSKAMDSDRQYEASKEAMLKGPSAFSLNRLLNIHNHLYVAAEHSSSASRRRSTLGGAGIAGETLCDVCVPPLMITSEVLDGMGRADREKLRRLEDGEEGPRRSSGAVGHGLQGPWSERHRHLEGDVNGSQRAGMQGRGMPAGGQAGGAGTGQALTMGGQGVQGMGTNTGRLSLGGGGDLGREVGVIFAGRPSIGGGGDLRRLSLGGGGDLGRVGLGGQGGALGGARLSGSSSMWGLQETDVGLGVGSEGLGGLGRGGGHTTRAPGSHLPHPASGAVRHGKAHVSPEAAGVFSTIASLASMGLLLREKSDDPLEAPRFTVAINKSLAADLARSMGLDIHSYLKLG